MDTIKFKYKFSEDYNPKYANGAIGGINPQGEIVINFYLERNGLPISQTFELKNSNTIGDLKETDPVDFSKSIIRYIQNGVVLNYSSAKEIHRWLGEHLDKIESGEVQIKK